MVYSRALPAAFAALITSATVAQADALQINALIDVPDSPRTSLFFGSDGGEGGGSEGGVAILKPRRDMSSAGTPAGLPGAGSEEQQDHDYALVCQVMAKGALRFSNRGGETMPSGLKIKWRAGDRQGAFRLNVDLQPGASAAAPGILEDDGTKSCWAAVI